MVFHGLHVLRVQYWTRVIIYSHNHYLFLIFIILSRSLLSSIVALFWNFYESDCQEEHWRKMKLSGWAMHVMQIVKYLVVHYLQWYVCMTSLVRLKLLKKRTNVAIVVCSFFFPFIWISWRSSECINSGTKILLNKSYIIYIVNVMDEDSHLSKIYLCFPSLSDGSMLSICRSCTRARHYRAG